MTGAIIDIDGGERLGDWPQENDRRHAAVDDADWSHLPVLAFTSTDEVA